METDQIPNLIIVGGTIAAGKSTLVQRLSGYTGWQSISELREGDKLQEMILEKLYEGKRIHSATIQYYFLIYRLNQYKEILLSKKSSILDRGVWEDWFFAKLLMSDDPKSYEHYQILWKKTIQEMIVTYGKPTLYIYMRIDWLTFKERIFTRGRNVELENFHNNEAYFENLLNLYNSDFVFLLQEWGIEYFQINTTHLSPDETFEKVLIEMKKRNILKPLIK